MTLKKLDRPSAASAESAMDSLLSFRLEIWAIAEVELRKLWRDPTEMFSRAVQPALWLAVFGQVMGHIRAIPTGNVEYQAFMTPGILAQSILFSAIFYGIAVIWERDLGIVHKLLVSPAHRLSLVIGKALSAGFRGLVQAIIVYFIAIVLNIPLLWNLSSLVGVAGTVMIGSALFSTFSLIIACLVRTRERFMGIGQVLTMPLFFASNAIYPLTMMPPWLRILARFYPLTYLVEILRALMLGGAQASSSVLSDFVILGLTLGILLAIAARLYPTLAR